MTEASIIGGSGYTGGELLRLVVGHPELELGQVTSRSEERSTVTSVHPNLRGKTDARFVHPDDLEETDVLFTATPHGYTMDEMPRLREYAETVVDLSGDFRLKDPDDYDEWYEKHPNPELLDDAVYGVPELYRDEIEDADLIAAAGCNATASILALYPLVENGVVGAEDDVVLDVKASSSAGGASASTASHHSERSRVVRPYAPTSHRHQAEIEQETGLDVNMTVHAIEMVRGIAATAHALVDGIEEKDLWKAYRGAYGDEPFVRVAKSRRGVYRYPEPKVVEGTNYCDVGFEVGDGRVVAFSAVDNMMKGSAGMAVQAANIALGFDETAGLEFTGMHPV
jgi:N-acetyl-gamma-glutamyl-phosphate/LysW-gamma-L-alpha-aminoadipyl-6-phosphate reductase